MVNIQKKIIVLLLCLLVILFAGIYLLYSQINANNVYIKDAYCDNDKHFNFTIVNVDSYGMDLSYKWHLDDPMSGLPRPIHNVIGFTDDYYMDNGNITVPGNSNRTIVITLPRDQSYPQMDLIMDIELFDGNKSIYHYREQKYSGEYKGQWNYSTLPPKQR